MAGLSVAFAPAVAICTAILVQEQASANPARSPDPATRPGAGAVAMIDPATWSDPKIPDPDPDPDTSLPASQSRQAGGSAARASRAGESASSQRPACPCLYGIAPKQGPPA